MRAYAIGLKPDETQDSSDWPFWVSCWVSGLVSALASIRGPGSLGCSRCQRGYCREHGRSDPGTPQAGSGHSHSVNRPALNDGVVENFAHVVARPLLARLVEVGVQRRVKDRELGAERVEVLAERVYVVLPELADLCD